MFSFLPFLAIVFSTTHSLWNYFSPDNLRKGGVLLSVCCLGATPLSQEPFLDEFEMVCDVIDLSAGDLLCSEDILSYTV